MDTYHDDHTTSKKPSRSELHSTKTDQYQPKCILKAYTCRKVGQNKQVPLFHRLCGTRFSSHTDILDRVGSYIYLAMPL